MRVRVERGCEGMGMRVGADEGVGSWGSCTSKNVCLSVLVRVLAHTHVVCMYASAKTRAWHFG